MLISHTSLPEARPKSNSAAYLGGTYTVVIELPCAGCNRDMARRLKRVVSLAYGKRCCNATHSMYLHLEEGRTRCIENSESG